MQKQAAKSGPSKTELAIIGASIAGIAAAAYFFLGPKGKEHQQQAKAWAIKMKGEVVEKLERAKEISEPIYQEIIDTVASKYEKAMNTTPEEVRALAQDLKKHWKKLSSSAKITKSRVGNSKPKKAE